MEWVLEFGTAVYSYADFSYPRPFVPKNKRSLWRTFVPGTFRRSRDLFSRELSFPYLRAHFRPNNSVILLPAGRPVADCSVNHTFIIMTWLHNSMWESGLFFGRFFASYSSCVKYSDRKLSPGIPAFVLFVEALFLVLYSSLCTLPLFMVALWNRADRYIFILSFVLLFSFTAILPNMVWP